MADLENAAVCLGDSSQFFALRRLLRDRLLYQNINSGFEELSADFEVLIGWASNNCRLDSADHLKRIRERFGAIFGSDRLGPLEIRVDNSSELRLLCQVFHDAGVISSKGAYSD